MPRALNLVFSMPWRGQIDRESIRQPRPPAPPIPSPTELNKMLITNLPPAPPASVTIQSGIDAATVTPPRTPRQVGAPDVPPPIDTAEIWRLRRLECPLDSEAAR